MIPNLYAHSGESNLANPLFVWTLDPSVVVITIFAYFYFRGLIKYRRKQNHKISSLVSLEFLDTNFSKF